MRTEHALQVKLEAIWWVVTFVILGCVLFPILSKLDNYQFLIQNSIFIIVFITFTRYLFQLKHTFLGKQQIIKMILMVICLPLCFYLIEQINYFQTTLDENGVEALAKGLPFTEQTKLSAYIRNQYIFFGVAAVISVVGLFFRLIVSLWRFRNVGSV